MDEGQTRASESELVGKVWETKFFWEGEEETDVWEAEEEVGKDVVVSLFRIAKTIVGERDTKDVETSWEERVGTEQKTEGSKRKTFS